MSELKRFLSPLSPYMWFLYTAGIAFPACIILFNVYLVVSGEMPLSMLFMPVFFFGAFMALMVWMLMRGMRTFDKWWAGFSAAEQAAIERDFTQGEPVSSYMIAGQRYAFMSHTCRILPYDRAGEIRLVRGKNDRCYMHIAVENEKEILIDLPKFSDAYLI